MDHFVYVPTLTVVFLIQTYCTIIIVIFYILCCSFVDNAMSNLIDTCIINYRYIQGDQ